MMGAPHFRVREMWEPRNPAQKSCQALNPPDFLLTPSVHCN
jgi:hypothetical protein